MGTITDKLTYLQDTKTAIKNAIVGKGVSVSDSDTFRSYANKISSITTSGGSSEWQPQTDWWDIDTILENDTEDYPAKIILLLTDTNDSIDLTITTQIAKIKTSDGFTYTTSGTHTWDKTQDKNCTLGYKTRYLIYYYTNVNFNVNYVLPTEHIYGIFENFTNYFGSVFRRLQRTGRQEALKFKNCVLDIDTKVLSLSNMYILQKIYFENTTIDEGRVQLQFEGDGLVSQSVFEKIIELLGNNFQPTNMTTFIEGNLKITKVPYIDTSQVTTFNRAFNGARSLITIENLDCNSCTTWGGNTFNCNFLQNINSVSNIKLSGLSFSNCPLLKHETLIRILNALYDYASEGSTDTYTLILGTINLAKLSDEEKAIATNKGWTLVERG